MSASSSPSSITEVQGFSSEAPPLKAMKPFKYRRPEGFTADRVLSPLVRTDIMLAMVQTFVGGGEQELHAHSAMDGFWFVLSGHARFYGDGDKLVAELGPHEGVLVPREARYWFEQCGDEPLEILQVEAIDRRRPNVVTKYGGKPPGRVDVFSSDGEMLAEGVQLSAGVRE